MSDLIASIPAVAEIDRQLAEIKNREDSYRQSITELAEADRVALEEWNRHVDQALAEGKPPPPRPMSSMSTDQHREAVSRFAAQRQQLMSRRRRAVGEALEEITENARKQIAKAMKDAPKHLRALEEIAGQVLAARSAVAEASQAADENNGQRRDMPRTNFTITDLVNAGPDDDLLAGLGSERPLGFVEWSAAGDQAPEPGEIDRAQAAAHANRLVPRYGRGY